MNFSAKWEAAGRGVADVRGVDLADGGDGLADFNAFDEVGVPVAGVIVADVGEEQDIKGAGGIRGGTFLV